MYYYTRRGNDRRAYFTRYKSLYTLSIRFLELLRQKIQIGTKIANHTVTQTFKKKKKANSNYMYKEIAFVEKNANKFAGS